jgi:hypothetical protein
MRIALALLLVACDGPCPNQPLAPLMRAPRFGVVMTNEGGEGGGVLDEFAAIALFDERDVLIHERWIDSRTEWEDERLGFDAASVLPDQIGPRLSVAIDARLVAFGVPDGELAFDVDAGEVIVAASPVDEDSTALSLANAHVAIVRDAAIALDVDLSTSFDTLGEIAPLGTRLIVGTGSAAVAIVDPTDGTFDTVDLPSSECLHIVAIDTERVAVACAADLAIIDAGGNIERTPYEGRLTELVALEAPWIAGVARVETSEVLIAIDVTTGDTHELFDELDSRLWGSPLGRGAFVEDTLLWPSVARGIRRFRMEEIEGAARFVPEPDLGLPACYQFPARHVRAIPLP